ncbi:MAG: sulfotransferase domain-containing protein [Bacteroidota bacterium]
MKLINSIKRKWQYERNAWRSDTVALPRVLILGAQKAATTSLHYYLTRDPQIRAGRTKEINFFNWNYEKGKRYYKRQFDIRENVRYIDASPNYLYHPDVPGRVADLLGTKVKLIVSLRDPVKRAYSTWNMHRDQIKDGLFLKRWQQREQEFPEVQLYSRFCVNGLPTFEDAAREELKWIENSEDILEPSLLRRGFYVEQIERWLQHFPRECFYFLASEQLQQVSSFRQVMLELEDFLEIRPSKLPLLEPRILNKRAYKHQKINTTILQELQQLFTDKNRGLEDLTGLSIPWITNVDAKTKQTI